MTTHRALIRNFSHGADLNRVATPDCGPNDVIVAPRFVGICGSDIQAYSGVTGSVSSILGHEGVGLVIEAGESVKKYSPGDPVVFNPVNPIDQDEVLGKSFDGLFQEKILIRNVESAGWLIQPVSDTMLNPVGALIEPLATAIYSAELVDEPGVGKTAVVVGDGPIGLLNLIQLRSSRFETVLMIHGRSTRHQWVVKNGYSDTRDMIVGSGNVPGRVIERLGGELADAVVICTPHHAVEQALHDAINYIKPGGVINVVSTAVPSVASFAGFDLNVGAICRQNHSGYPASGFFERVESSTDGKVIRITGHCGTSFSHINAGIELLRRYRHKFEALVTEIIDFDETPMAISSVVDRSPGSAGDLGAMKIVVELNRNMA